MQWISIKDELPDTTRGVFASNGKRVVIAHYSQKDSDWFNIMPILPGYQNWIDVDKTPIIFWIDIGELVATLPRGES